MEIKESSFLNCRRVGLKRITFIVFNLSIIINTGYAVQNTIISSGTSVYGKTGNLIAQTNIINNGTFNNTDNRVSFTGSDPTLSGASAVDFENVYIGNGSVLNITSPGHKIHGILLCDGTVNSGGNITLVSDSSATALIDGNGTGDILGDIIMQRYLPSGFGYRYISSPFQSSTVNELADEIDLLADFPLVYKYDESRASSGWIDFTDPSNVLNPLAGYCVNFGSSASPITFDLTGIPNNGPISLNLFNHGMEYTEGYNLVGNPYPSPIDWDAEQGWIRTNIDDAVYFFKPGTTDEYTGTYVTYLEGISSDGVVNNIIPSMQGFFVHVTNGPIPVSAILTMNNQVRITNMSQSFAKSEKKGSISLVRFAAGFPDDPTSYDPMVIYYDEKATYNFNGQLDALKLFNTDAAVPSFYVFSRDNKKLSIDALPLTEDSTCILRLGLMTARPGEIEFKIRDISGLYLNLNIVLIDTVTGVSTNLGKESGYRVYLPEGDFQNRFFLNFKSIKTNIHEIPSSDDSFRTWCIPGGTLKAEIKNDFQSTGEISIFNLYGQDLYKVKIFAPGTYELHPSIKNGIYLVCFTFGNKRLTRKVNFRN